MNAIRTKDTHTNEIAAMLQDYDIRFSRNDGWEILVEHVLRHQELLVIDHGVRAGWHEAVFSWHETVFLPIFRTISPWGYRHAFGRHEIGDLYLAVSDHWGYLKERDPDATPSDAARSFLSTYGSGISRHFSRYLVSENW